MHHIGKDASVPVFMNHIPGIQFKMSIYLTINDYISQIHYFCFVFFQYYSIKYRILVNLFIYSLLTSFQATLLTFLHCIWLKWANAHLDHQLMLSQVKSFTPHVFPLQKGKR